MVPTLDLQVIAFERTYRLAFQRSLTTYYVLLWLTLSTRAKQAKPLRTS